MTDVCVCVCRNTCTSVQWPRAHVSVCLSETSCFSCRLWPPHPLLVFSSSSSSSDVQGVVRQCVLRLVVVVWSQHGPCPRAGVIRWQHSSELWGQRLGLNELMERVQVVTVEVDLRRHRGEERRKGGVRPFVTAEADVRQRRKDKR